MYLLIEMRCIILDNAQSVDPQKIYIHNFRQGHGIEDGPGYT
jgi:hypothetical protein